MPGFKAPDELLPSVPPERMQERRRLLNGLLNPANSAPARKSSDERLAGPAPPRDLS